MQRVSAMARPRRIQIADLTQHVINRGNNRSDIFRADEDYLFFLVALATQRSAIS
jgi:hypothetical protein